MIFGRAKKEPQVFFVRGFQRSGTNWVCNLVKQHPDVSCTGEFHLGDLYQAYQKTINRQYGLLKFKPASFRKRFEEFISDTVIAYNDDRPLVGDRTPEAIHRTILTNGKYLLIQRDGRDVAVSWMYHLMRLDHNFGPIQNKEKDAFKKDPNHFESNKDKLINPYWAKKIAKDWNNRVLRDAESIQNSLDGVYPIEVMPIQYEALIEHTQQIRDKMYSFLGIDPAKAPKLNDQTSPGFAKMDTRSHYRKGEAGRWKLYFSEELLDIFESEAHEGLRHLGYEVHTQ